jgi:hypothetical protein
MSCDLTNGRLLNACSLGRAGIKTLYFTKFNDFDALTGVTELDGEITSLGADPITIYQFDMEDNVGMFDEALTTDKANGTSFVTQVITLTLLNIKPADLANINNMKRGRWAIWALDFEGKIRLFGRLRGCLASGGSDVSGAAPGDKKGLDMVLTAVENSYAVFMEDYTTVPFDNFANVTVVSGEALGPELHVAANAASDPNGNEADATTGWVETNLSGTGANVFESQSGVVNVGSYALHSDANDTPSANARFQQTIAGTVPGKKYRLTFDWRHIGTGGIWELFVIDAFVGISVSNADTTWQTVSYDVTSATTVIIVRIAENSATNDGGVYLDNLSLREIL